MSIKKRIRDALEKAFNVKIYRILPRGIDPFADLKRSLPSWNAQLIFDVGANVGQSAKQYVNAFPGAKILCFEPCGRTYNQLALNLSSHGNVSCFRLAFGEANSIGRVEEGSSSVLSRVVDLNQQESDAESSGGESVEIQTIDSFCRDHQIETISYLKIDTEGNDLSVLKGAREMLMHQKVAAFEVEAGVCPENSVHVPFNLFLDYLEPHAYKLFGFYEQTSEWTRGLARMRRVNLVFISAKLEGAAKRVR